MEKTASFRPRELFSPLNDGERSAASFSGRLAFILALVAYWLTVAPSVSYWDCPEYVITAVRLEVGHPPGNPFWTLFHRFLTIFVHSSHAALAINMASGVFSACAVALLSRILAVAVPRLLRCRGRKVSEAAGVVGALCGSLMFAWCDSVWFSAVEAEVYAMSVFLTVLSLWLMLRWCLIAPGPRASRMLLLIAYLTGLSLGVHQLNLLSLPVLGLLYLWRRYPLGFSCRTVFASLVLSFLLVVMVLKGIMPGTVWLAGCAELLAVNTLGLPFNSGWSIYLCLLFISGSATVGLLSYGHRKSAVATLSVFLLLSGLFFPTVSIAGAAVVSLIAGVLLLLVIRRPSLHKILMATWSLLLLLIGYSSLMLIPIRAAANPYLNTGFPSNPLSLFSYIEREQYGGAPLLRGATPYSKPMLTEEFGPDSVPVYTRIALDKGHPIWTPAVAGAVLSPRSGFLSAADTSANSRRLREDRDAYLLADYKFSRITTPELDMWFPRLTSSNPSDISAYESWVGMDTASMVRVRVSEAFDSLGRPVTRMGPDGNRPERWSYRPTYLQNLQFFLGYQTGYMYFRYLLWNFAGRQNDINTAGEAEHGNFLTGFSPLDDAMLGSQSRLPSEAGRDNPGRNIYWSLPLLICLLGGVVLWRSGRPGRIAAGMIFLLFLLTGAAIVVYLNQTVGEPRERDYSFLGSFFAFAAFGGFGGAWIVALTERARRPLRRILRVAAYIFVLGIPVLMLVTNYDDHDRSRRDAATDFAINTLSAQPKDAILFVDGDNYTFPLWYAQEVLGVRRDVTVVSLAYLSLPQYVASLAMEREDGLPIAMAGTPGVLLYGRYLYTRFPDRTTDTIVPDIHDFLCMLYSDTQSPRAVLPASRIYIRKGSDSITVDLREVARGSGSPMLGQRQLAILDIVASNLGKRPICWLSHLPQKAYAGMRPLTREGLFSRIITTAPRISDKDTIILSPLQLLDSLRWGGLNLSRPPYADPTVQSMVSWQRGALIREGRRRLERGNASEALRWALAAADSLSSATAPYGYTPVEGIAFWDGRELGNLLVDAGTASSDTAAQHRGHQILLAEKNRAEAWRAWREQLPPRLRQAVGYNTLRFLRNYKDSNP